MSASNATLKCRLPASAGDAGGAARAEPHPMDVVDRVADQAPYGTATSLPGGAAVAITGWTRDTALWVDFTVLIDGWRAGRS